MRLAFGTFGFAAAAGADLCATGADLTSSAAAGFAFRSGALLAEMTFGFSSTRLLALVAGASSAFWASSVPSWVDVSCVQNVSAWTGPLARAAASCPLKYVHPSVIGASTDCISCSSKRVQTSKLAFWKASPSSSVPSTLSTACLHTENMSKGFWLMATRHASWRAVAFAGSSAVEAARDTRAVKFPQIPAAYFFAHTSPATCWSSSLPKPSASICFVCSTQSVTAASGSSGAEGPDVGVAAGVVATAATAAATGAGAAVGAAGAAVAGAAAGAGTSVGDAAALACALHQVSAWPSASSPACSALTRRAKGVQKPSEKPAREQRAAASGVQVRSCAQFSANSRQLYCRCCVSSAQFSANS